MGRSWGLTSGYAVRGFSVSAQNANVCIPRVCRFGVFTVEMVLWFTEAKDRLWRSRAGKLLKGMEEGEGREYREGEESKL